MSGIPEATPINLSTEEGAELEGLARSTKTEHRLRQGARIVLFAADRMASRAIGRAVGCTTGTASKWRVRYGDRRLAGLDETGNRGTEPKYTAQTGRRILVLLGQPPRLSEVVFAITGTRWSGPRFFGIRDKSSPGGREERAVKPVRCDRQLPDRRQAAARGGQGVQSPGPQARGKPPMGCQRRSKSWGGICGTADLLGRATGQVRRCGGDAAPGG